MQKLILENLLSPGDILMLTAAVRDLHRCHPGRFATDVRTSCPALWDNNPWLTPLEDDDPEVQRLVCHYPLIHESNNRPFHFLHGFTRYLNEQLGLAIEPTEFRGDIHLSTEELAAPPLITERAGVSPPYWIIVAGGKYDFTIKWWHRRRWQAVVDHFAGRVQFVQVGEKGHYHPRLNGTLDFRFATTLRELVHLVYHADGILCPITLIMHLAAAVPLPPGRKRARGCVVVAGGREPSHWEAYPTHQYLHTVGALDCCGLGGCWKSRTVPIGDGSSHDRDSLCTNVTSSGLARCMEMITPEEVIVYVERYLENR
jgi:ADP-heptose:LPS heptosyltransferase